MRQAAVKSLRQIGAGRLDADIQVCYNPKQIDIEGRLMLAGERTGSVPPKENTLRRSAGNEDCKWTALWRHPPRAGAEGAKRVSVNLSGKRTERHFHPGIPGVVSVSVTANQRSLFFWTDSVRQSFQSEEDTFHAAAKHRLHPKF